MNSISDRNDYKQVCLNASKYDLVFNAFKKNPAYNGILEHVSFEQGESYLEFIKSNAPEYIDCIDKFKGNDLYGGTLKYEYDEIGLISPSTLRYIKVLSDIKNIFKDLNQ